MGWRFRRSIRLAPGLRWNFGKKSTSVSIGPRGLTVTAGTSGVRRTISIPGTGLSHTEMIGSAQPKQAGVRSMMRRFTEWLRPRRTIAEEREPTPARVPLTDSKGKPDAPSATNPVVSPQLVTESNGPLPPAELATLSRLVGNVLSSLSAPLEEMVNEIQPPPTAPLSAKEYLLADFERVIFRVASADGDVSSEEAAVYRSLFHSIAPEWVLAQQSAAAVIGHVRGAVAANRNAFTDRLGEPATVSILRVYDTRHATTCADRLATALFRVGNLVAKVHEPITPAEEAEIRKLKPSIQGRGSTNTKSEDVRTLVPSDAKGRSLEELLDELNNLIGLAQVKRDVQELANYVQVQQLRKAKGLKGSEQSLHVVFSGNPGTGKTTVARLLAEIYRALGVLRTGQLVETDRAGLVAGFVGQTAPKVALAVEQALGGVLFIDEAYALTRQGSGNDADFGHEALETLLKRMEDNRDDLVVIAAGYTEEMAQFVTANPGLQSRFTRTFRFDDYTPEQLVAIVKNLCRENDYRLSAGAEATLMDVFRRVTVQASCTFRRDSVPSDA